MIKIKIHNSTTGRNEITFRPFLQLAHMLRDYSIEITNSNDYDFLFIGMHDFIDKKRPLKESIDYGLNFLESITGDYFLFDGSDSTSLMGSYEVFKQSNAIYLFKNQLLKNCKDYQNKTAFNKWFFGNDSGLDLSYNIPKKDWDRIKLSNINCGRTIFGTGIPANANSMLPINSNKHIDICAIFQAEHPYCEDHGVRNDIPYTLHRKGLWDKLSGMKSKYTMLTKKMDFQIYMERLAQSKICISPFGQGELCFRDFEAMLAGTILIKPDQSNITTSPNIFVEGETYIGCNHDWSNLEERIDYVLNNFNELNEKIIYNTRNMYIDQYTHHNFCMYYHNLFSNLDTVK